MTYSDPLAEHIPHASTAAKMRPAPRPVPPISANTAKPQLRPAPIPTRPTISRDASPGDVPMPAKIKFSVAIVRDALAAGMTQDDIDGVMIQFQADHGADLKPKFAWGSATTAVLMTAIRAHRAGTTPAKAISVSMAPPVVEPVCIEPEASGTEPDGADDWDAPAPEVDVVPDEPTWFREMCNAGMDAIDEAADDVETPANDISPVSEEPTEAEPLTQEEPAPKSKRERKAREKAPKPDRLASFEYDDKIAWLTAVNFEPGMTAAGGRAASFLALAHN